MQIQTSHSMLNIGLTVESLAHELEDVFPLTNPTSDTPINLIMYRSGQRSVVEWITQRIKNEEL
jgi:hypothetical protein